MPAGDAIQALERYRRQLAASDTAALNRLVNAYGQMYQRLQDKIELLLKDIADKDPTRGQVVRLTRYKDLMAQTAEELQRYGALTEAIMNEQAALGIQLGERQARELASIMISGNTGLAARFHVLPNEAIKSVLGFLAPDSPLTARIRELAPFTADIVSQTLLEAVGLGYNPRKTAKLLEDAYGRGLTDSLRMTRTVQLYSYREANRASYLANSDVVDGWIWYAELDADTCMSCVAEHGSLHPNTETLNDHHNGRCAMLPAVKGFELPLQDGAGRDWFENQPEAVQQKMMGRETWQAWKDGAFGIENMTTERPNDVYGNMRTQTPLWELLGAEPPLRTK